MCIKHRVPVCLDPAGAVPMQLQRSASHTMVDIYLLNHWERTAREANPNQDSESDTDQDDGDM